MKQLPDAELFSKLRDTIRTGTYVIPDRLGYRGTGGPGLLLENILGFEPNNRDGPDSGKWEIKFHGGSSPLTLFHKTPEPKGNMHSFVRLCGWPDKHGRTSFRHTIYGKSERGFEIVSEGGRILIRNLNHRDLISPYWTHDTILNAFAYKLRRLAIVHGSVTKKSRTVTYESACLYWEPSITS
ncbi:MAG: MvaI/BcnI family restriction endonuclease, partial [Myxococcota bacterium]